MAKYSQLNLATEESNQNSMAKSRTRKTKSDYIDELNVLVFEMSQKLTVKQIRQLIAKYAHS